MLGDIGEIQGRYLRAERPQAFGGERVLAHPPFGFRCEVLCSPALEVDQQDARVEGGLLGAQGRAGARAVQGGALGRVALVPKVRLGARDGAHRGSLAQARLVTMRVRVGIRVRVGVRVTGRNPDPNPKP